MTLESLDTCWRADEQKYGLFIGMGTRKFVQLVPMHATPAEVADALEQVAKRLREDA